MLAVVAASVAPASGEPSETPYVHSSGLTVVGPSPIDPIPDSAAESYGLALRLAEENPGDFSYPWIENDRTAVAGTSAETVGMGSVDSTRRASVILEFLKGANSRNSSDLPTEKRLPATPEVADSLSRGVLFSEGTDQIASYGVIRKLQDEVFDFSIGNKYSDAGAWQTEIGINGNVILTVETLTDGLAEDLVARFGRESFQVRILEHPGTMPQSRSNDSSPFKGGAMLELPSSNPSSPTTGYCSSAFAWKDGADWRMFTAGHCAPTGAWPVDSPNAYMGWVTEATRENWTKGTGTVALAGTSSLRGDLALIEMSLPRAASPKMYTGPVGSSTWRWVGEMWSRRAQAGDGYCVGGTRGGELCGWVVSAVGVNHRYTTGETVRPAVVSRGKTGACARPGDSGGPVYTVNPQGAVAAKGVHSGGFSGGDDFIGGVFDPCIEVFTDIWDAYIGFPGSLAVS